MTVPHHQVHKRVFRILVAAGREFGSDKATRLSAALSFYTLFSLVPLLFVTVAVVGFVSSDSALTGTDCDVVTAGSIPANVENPIDRVLRQVDEVAGREVADSLARITCQASDDAPRALSIGIALAVFSASSIFLHVQGVLNLLFHAPEEQTKGVTRAIVQRATAVVAAVVLSVLVITPLVAVASVNFLRELITVQWLRSLLGVAVPLSSLLLLVLVVTMTFRLLSRADIPWRAARRGGIFTALTGLLGAYLVGAYLSAAGGEGALGVVGGAAILLFFFNLMWMIFIFGVEVTKVYADYLAFGDVLAPSERTHKPSFEPAGAGAREGRAGTETERVESEDRPVRRSGLIAFFIGLATGWAARRRNS